MAEEGSEFATSESMGLFDMIGRVATGSDWFKFYLGLTLAFTFGAANPVFCLFFGEMIDSMNDSGADDGFDSLTFQAKIFCIIAGIVLIISWG